MKKVRLALVFMLIAAICLSISVFSASAENSAPVAENLELRTYSGVSVGGRLCATDPEGDLITFELTTDPVKGNVELESDGRFIYTPAEGKKGRDYFGFRAVDCNGSCSQEGTVIIKIEKQKCAVSYSDMSGSSSEYAAVVLAEHGLFTGEQYGSEYVFEPDREVTRAQFLTMCMKLDGGNILSGVRSTGFSDDDDIAVWLKPYVSTALMNGVISGYSDGAQAVFCPGDSISCAEAAVMLDNILSVTDVISTSAISDSDAVPAWAFQSVANLAACRIIDTGIGSLDSPLTRARAAEMLSNAVSLLEDR